MKSRLVYSIVLLLFLGSLFPVSAHESHNEYLSSDGYYWTWDAGINAGDSHTWFLQMWDDGEVYLEGDIDITVKQSLRDYNLLSFFDREDNSITFERYTNAYFDIKFDDVIAYYSTVYHAKYFYAPIFFQHENGSQYNLLDSSMTQDNLYLGLINETIDLTCLQGCHTEDNNPFSTTKVWNYMEGDNYIIEGEFMVNEFLGSELYGYDGGTFMASYTLDGILQEWNWISGDGLEKLEITKYSLSNKQKSILIYYVGVPLILFSLLLVYIIKFYLPSRLKRRRK